MESPRSETSADEERGLAHERRKAPSKSLMVSRSLRARRKSATAGDISKIDDREENSDASDDDNDKGRRSPPAGDSPQTNPSNSTATTGAGARQVIGDLFTGLRKNIGLETRAEKKERGDDEGPIRSSLTNTSVSAFTQDVMERSSRLRQQMKTMMDRSGGSGVRGGRTTQARGGGEAKTDQPQGSDSESEDEKNTTTNANNNKTNIKGFRSANFTRSKQKVERNKENAGDPLLARDAGADFDTVDKLTSRLKRRGLTRRSSREEENSDGSDQERPSQQSNDHSRDDIDASHRYMRRATPHQLRTRRQLLDRVVAELAPEMHIIGEVSYGTGFGTGVSCRWILEMGKFWSHLAGDQYGQTHTVYTLPEDGDTAMATWNHPLDIHLTTTSMQGWPRLIVQVSNLDEYGRTSIVGYGFQHIPLVAGPSSMEITCWRPTGAMQDELAAYFLGVTPQLVDNDVIFTKAWDKRCRLVTLPSGKVYLQVNVILRHFAEHDVDIA